MEVAVEIETDDQRIRPDKSEVERLWADNSKALLMLDWSPRYSGKEALRRGLEKTIDWFRDPMNLKNYKNFTYAI